MIAYEAIEAEMRALEQYDRWRSRLPWRLMTSALRLRVWRWKAEREHG